MGAPQTARPSTLSLSEIRGPGYPVPGSAPGLLVSYIKALLQDSEPAALDRYKRATQNLLFYDGRQHIDWSLRDRQWKDLPPVDGTIRVTMNYIRPILRSRMQRLMSSELAWRVIPRSNDHEEKDRCVVGENVIKARFAASEMDAKIRQGLTLADCAGVSYLKQFWNPNIGTKVQAQVVLPHPATGEPATYPVDPEGRPLADDRGDPLDGSDLAFSYRPGDTDTALRTIFNVRVNPDASGLESADGFRWLMDSEVLPISVVKERYGQRARKVQSAEGISAMRQFENIVRAISPGRSDVGNDLLSGRSGQNIPDRDLTLLTEYWEAPTAAMPEGRLIVIAGSELLYPLTVDEEGLPQGFVPYVELYSERRPFDAGGRPIVDDLTGPNRVINKQWSCILMEQHLAGVGQWAMFDIPGLSEQITNGAGAHVKIPVQSALANRSIGDLIQRIQGAQSSPDRWRMIQEAKATMFDLGNFHEIQRGSVPPGVDSGVAVQLLQEAENGQLHDAVRTLKRSLVRWSRQTGMIAKWGYGEDEARWVSVQRPDLGYLIESVKGTDLPDFESMDIDLEGFKPTSRAAQNAEIKDAMKEGWIDPRQGLGLMDLGRGIEGVFESQTRQYTKARRENLAIEKGEFQIIEGPPNQPLDGFACLMHPDGSPFILPADDDHLVHIALHQEIALDDSRPWPTRQAALLEIAGHRVLLQQQLVPAPSAPPADPTAKTPQGASA